MRFRTSDRRQPPRAYQTRIMSMVMLLALVAVMMQSASKPSTWYWLTGGEDGSGGVAGQKQRKISFQPQLNEPSDLAEDEFRVVAVASLKTDLSVPPDADRAGDEFRIPAERLSLIQDNSLGIRAVERNVYYEMLAKVRDAEPEKLNAVAQDAVAFSLLMTESSRYIGSIITVKGELRRLTPLTPGANTEGVEQLWEAWLFNRDSGLNPYCIRCLKIPDGIPTGQELKSGTIVTVTGYFFKRYGYSAPGDRLHLAPMILASTLSWHQGEANGREANGKLLPWIVGGVGSLGLLLGVFWLRIRAADQRFERETVRRLALAVDRIDVEPDEPPAVGVDEFLRQLSEPEPQPEFSADDGEEPGCKE